VKNVADDEIFRLKHFGQYKDNISVWGIVFEDS